MKNCKKYAISFILLVFVSLSYAQTESFESVAFRAMQEEMIHNMENLKLDNLKPPYYIRYLISDANLYSVETQLGAVVKVIDTPQRELETSVLVGNHKRNNLNYSGDNQFGSSGVSVNIPMTLENNYEAIRRSLWAETDGRYKQAAEIIESKLASINQQNLPIEEIELADYSDIPQLQRIIPSQNIHFDKNKIESLSKNLSAIFKNYPHLTKSGVTTYIFTADALFANTEDIKYKVPFSVVCIRVYAETVAIDGEPLMDYLNFYYQTPDQIPPFEVLKKQVNEMATLLTQLRTAPVIHESYSGPVMFEGEAVGEIVSQCFVDNHNGLLASRKLIVSNPQRIPARARENKLEQMYGKKVISRELSVTAVRNKKTFNGVPLIGYYEIDAQGVVPDSQTVLIEDGVLRTLLSNRIPTMKNATSNGSQCFAISDGALTTTLASGILEFSSSETMSYAELKAALLAAAKEEDFEYAYIVKKVASPMAGVPGLSAYMSASSTGTFAVSRPIYIYRISVKDGMEELVRTAKIADLSLKSFKRIVGVAAPQEVYNTMQRGKRGTYYQSRYALVGVPASFIVPKAIVFQEIEIEKDKDIVYKKEPIVPSPMMTGK